MHGQLFKQPCYRIAGDDGLLVDYGEGIDPEVNAKVRAIAKAMEINKLEGVTEVIPTYRSLLLIYDPVITNPKKLSVLLSQLEKSIDYTEPLPFKLVEIPVCYGGEFGPDIDNVARTNHLSIQDVIDMHSQSEYLIYMVGFTPGFPFLGGLDKRLFTPRLKNPRMMVPEGSVGIANNQTGMYPIASPGGWQLIGRTPLTLFAPERPNPFLYRAGDKIKFVPISKAEYNSLFEKEKN